MTNDDQMAIHAIPEGVQLQPNGGIVRIGATSPQQAQLAVNSSVDEALSIARDGIVRLHMVTGATKGVGLFGTYLAIQNTYGTPNPQLRLSNSPSGSYSTIEASDVQQATVKHEIHVKASGSIWLWPTNSDPIRVVGSSLEPFTDNTGSLGSPGKRWANCYLGNITIADGSGLVLSATTGSQIGTTVSQKLAFHGAAPTAQRASAAQATVETTPATQTTPYGYSTQAQADAIVTLANEMRAALVEKGLIKGSV